nr:pilus assembly protein [Micromonospora sp. DSM 115978]
MAGRRRRDDRGVSSLELAIVTPAVLLLIFFIVQVALWWYGRNVALQAAREGVSQLRLVQPTDDVEAAQVAVEDSVVDFAATLGQESLLGPAADSVYDPDEGRVSVTVTGDVVSLVPGLTLSVSQQAYG